jgi:hypothetical protein
VISSTGCGIGRRFQEEGKKKQDKEKRARKPIFSPHVSQCLPEMARFPAGGTRKVSMKVAGRQEKDNLISNGYRGNLAAGDYPVKKVRLFSGPVPSGLSRTAIGSDNPPIFQPLLDPHDLTAMAWRMQYNRGCKKRNRIRGV